MSSSFSFPGAALAYLLLCWRSVERSLTIFFPFISETGALLLGWNLLISLQIFHPSPPLGANKLGETCNRDSPSSRFYFIMANSLVRLALSAPIYYQVDFIFSASTAGELAPVCVVLPLLVVFPRLWVYLENPIPHNSKSRLVLTVEMDSVQNGSDSILVITTFIYSFTIGMSHQNTYCH